MKRLVAALVVLAVAASAAFAIEVDRKELESGDAGKAIEFINYTGPQTVISSIEEIRGIGSSLGATAVKTGSAGDPARYYVIHAVDAAVKEGLDADILILGPLAGVDHIDNLRRIIGSYLSAAYGYSEKDSSTLATFITVYNAVYRGKLEAFKSRYKPLVVSNLHAEKAGLSVRYDEWPGRSEIVIPLSDPRLSGTISSIDTTAISGKEVVEKIKEDKGTATDTRKSMADIKEREGDAAQTRADTSQKEATDARAAQAAKQKDLAVAEKDAAQAQKTAEAAKAEAAAKPGDKAAQQKAEAAQKTADEKTAAVSEKKADVAKSESTVKQKETNANADQKLADTKQKETLAERKDIAADEQKAVDQKAADAKKSADSALAAALPAFALRVVDETSFLAELVIVNLNDGKILKTSPLNAIRGRAIYDTGAGFMAIAGKKGGNAAIRLVLVDSTTLEMTKQGTDSIAEQSVLVQSANDYYAVIDQGSGKCVIGRFDKNLDAKAKSAINVLPSTAITVTQKGILVQDKSGKIKLLRATDLVDQNAE
jgi:hypothetical protein